MKIKITAFLLAFALGMATRVPGQKREHETNIATIEVKNPEFAEVLLSSSLVTKVSNPMYSCRVFSCNNGPGNQANEAIVFSTNYYIAFGKSDKKAECKLFKLGPFFEVTTATVVPGTTGETYILTIQHGHKGLMHKFQIAFGKISEVKK